ncbi:ABC transporter permease [Metamycoplasma neophronis]|uniref:ABC transporter permease n=1 Tax=Metamycoplasma neophronis TaxID=872983 RepID=A0ABY2Z1J4_9BACT|nr:ABC transporter permease [Metamycoplasma neophronis]TPR54688.1 ABC transporter permease [Metamycoplasma neophronis]
MINFSYSKYGGTLLFQNLKSFFNPAKISTQFEGNNLFILSLKFLWYSIKLIFLGTTIGMVIALFTSYFSNYKMNSFWIAIPFKIIVITLRLLPELFFVYLFTMSADKTLAINLIFTWFTWLWLHEYFSQTIENSNFTIFYHIAKIKHSRFKAFVLEIWPQIKLKVFNFVTYAFESNLRWSAILSKLSFLGIGILINPPENTKNYYNQLMTPLLVLVTFVFLLELINISLNKLFKSFNMKTIDIKKYERKVKVKKVFVFLLAVLSIVIIGLAIKTLHGQKFYLSNAKNYFYQLFNPNTSSVSFMWNSQGIPYMVIQLFALVFIATILIYGITYIKLFFMTYQLTNKTVSVIFRLTNSFMRAVPTLTIFLLVSVIYNGYPAAFVVAFAIHGAATLSRSIEGSVRKLPNTIFEQLKKQGYSVFKIYNNYVLSAIRLDLITLMSFEIEKSTRNFITYGLYSASALGSAATINRIRDIQDISIYLWIGFVIIAFINFFAYLIRLKITKNFSIIQWLKIKKNKKISL